MIRNTEEFLAALRAARRASTPLVSIRTADPASAIALTTRSLNGDAEGTSLLSWGVMTGLSALNGPGKKMLDSIIGERNPETVGPADALSVAVKLGDDAVLFYANPQRLWHDPVVVQGQMGHSEELGHGTAIHDAKVALPQDVGRQLGELHRGLAHHLGFDRRHVDAQ